MRTLIDIVCLDGTLVFRSDLRHSLTVIICGQFNHEIVYHRLFVTSPFMRQCVRGVPDRNISWSRVTRIYLILFFLGIKNDRDSSYSDFMGQSNKAPPCSVFVEQSDRTSSYSGFSEQSDIASPCSGFTE